MSSPHLGMPVRRPSILLLFQVTAPGVRDLKILKRSQPDKIKE
jgi:hypothetical protein